MPEEAVEGGPEGVVEESSADTASSASASAPETSSPGTTEVQIGENKFVVTEQMAEALKRQTEGFNQQFAGLNEQISRLQASMPPPETAGEPKDEPIATYNYETGLFENTNQAVENIINTAVLRAEEKLTNRYTEAEAQKQHREAFWKEFYGYNDDLVGSEIVVDAVLARDQDLLGMTPKQAGSELAERTRAELLKLGASKTDGGKKAPVVEGAPEKVPTTEQEPQKAEAPESMGDLLRQRAKSKAEARKHFKVVN